MMKPQDLMVGDLISMGGVIRVVTGIHDKETENGVDLITTMIPGHTFPDSNLSFRASYCYPIPLTPEILEKNGFVMDERDGVAVRYSFATDLHKPKQTVIQFAFYDGDVSADTLFKCWTSPKDCDGINDLHICDLKFVHELQHALRICGIDKEIVL